MKTGYALISMSIDGTPVIYRIDSVYFDQGAAVLTKTKLTPLMEVIQDIKSK